MADLSPVFDYALLYNDRLAFADMLTVVGWVNADCDVDKDILPTMQMVICRYRGKSKIGSFSYFTNPILEARDKRKASEATAPALTPDEALHAKARRLKWVQVRYRNMHMPQEFRWLADYEAKYGEVKL